ncbi:hypothetical protein DL93DRAFT_447332 [Clavulina sp. PMI_390]|nr:hypothetical protein DL93DRAFT_447332 [Clavulina sp. PMI_390]
MQLILGCFVYTDGCRTSSTSAKHGLFSLWPLTLFYPPFPSTPPRRSQIPPIGAYTPMHRVSLADAIEKAHLHTYCTPGILPTYAGIDSLSYQFFDSDPIPFHHSYLAPLVSPPPLSTRCP